MKFGIIGFYDGIASGSLHRNETLRSNQLVVVVSNVAHSLGCSAKHSRTHSFRLCREV